MDKSGVLVTQISMRIATHECTCARGSENRWHLPSFRISASCGRVPAQLPSEVQGTRQTGHEKDKLHRPRSDRVFFLLADRAGVSGRHLLLAPTRSSGDDTQAKKEDRQTQ
jgi:hypothetical protein